MKMKYQFYGKKFPHYGKTLWEVLANLKNFGVNRLVKRSSNDKFEEPCFYKIVKVQAYPPSRQPFEDRYVEAWAEEIYRGVRIGTKIVENAKYPEFILIPKIEEEKYYKACEVMDDEKRKKYLSKYCEWPPLYKFIWEKTAKKQYGPISNLKAMNPEYPGYDIIEQDKIFKRETCSLYQSKLSVEEMYREIVSLKKLIKANS